MAVTSAEDLHYLEGNYILRVPGEPYDVYRVGGTIRYAADTPEVRVDQVRDDARCPDCQKCRGRHGRPNYMIH